MALKLGRSRDSTNGSQNATLKSIKLIIEKSQFKGGKIDANAINLILDAIYASLENSGKYALDIASKNNDAIIEKVKDIITKLYDAQTTNTSTSNDSNAISTEDVVAAITANLSNIQLQESSEKELSTKSNTDNTVLEDKLNEIKDTIGEESTNATTDTTNLNTLNDTTTVLTGFVSVKEYISSQFSTLQLTFEQIQGSTISFVKGTLSKPFSFMSDKLSTMSKDIFDKVKQPFAAIGKTVSGLKDKMSESFKNVMSSVGSALTNVALAPLKAIGGMFSALNPFKKKKKKKKSAEELKLAQMIDKVNDFIDNFFDRMMGYVDKFLDRILKSSKKIVDKLMTHILAWLLVNVVLLGVIFAIIIKLIAKPLMEILLPIMDFVSGLIDKIITFLTPIRDFLLNVLQDTWNIIKAPFEGFFRGISAFAESLGVALGKLVIGVADFMVDVLMPFLRDHLIPVLSEILDSIKELFVAIKPWIKPLVDTIFGILQELLLAIKPWIKPIVDVILSTLVEILDTVKQLFLAIKPVIVELGKFLATVFMDILKGVQFVYDKVVKPIVNSIGKFISIVSNIGKFLMDKLLEGLSQLPYVGHFFKPTGESAKIEEDIANTTAPEVVLLNSQDTISLISKVDALYDFVTTTVAAKLDAIVDHFNIEVKNNEVATIAITAPNTSELSKFEELETPELQINENDDIKDMIAPLPLFLNQFANNVQENFKRVLEKLDQPPLLPLSFVSEKSNTAAMENV